MKFEIGDRVVVTSETFGGMKGLTEKSGTVILERKDRNIDIGVEFDESFRFGHDCGGKGAEGRCRYGSSNELDFENSSVFPELNIEFDEIGVFESADRIRV